MNRPVLLDTCALIWIAAGATLRGDAEAVLQRVQDVDGGILVSPISAWEVGVLTARGRIALSREPHAWFEAALASGLRLAPMPPAVLIDSTRLPGSPPADPADRIIAATARALHSRLLTRDRVLLDYAAAGHIEAVEC